MRKILYSPGYGAGWTTWMYNKEMKKFALEYAPLIEAIESANANDDEEELKALLRVPEYGVGEPDFSKCHSIVKEFVKECDSRFGQVPFLRGLGNLEVAVVNGRVRIEEYDGSESVIEEGEDEGWM